MKIFKLGLAAALLALLAVFIGGCTIPEGAEAEGAGSFIPMIVFIVAVFVLFYLVMIRPQRRRQKEHEKLVKELKKGDQVITAGGIFGTIESTSEESVIIKVESGTVLRVAKSSVVIRRSQ